MLVTSMPPIAKNGTVAWSVAYRTRSNPTAGTARLGWGGVDRADADVVDPLRVHPLRVHRVNLSGGMSGEPDQHVGADHGADLRHRHVLLPYVHAVGAGIVRNQRTVVDDEQRAEPLAQLPCATSDRQKLLVAKGLVAQLHDVHPSGDRGSQQLGELTPPGCAVAHEVQPRVGQVARDGRSGGRWRAFR